MSYRSENHTSTYRKTYPPLYASSPSRPTMSSSWGEWYRRKDPSLDSYIRQPPGHLSGITLDIVDPIQTSTLNKEVTIIRTNEKEQLKGLNDRFAMFIDQVHKLEQQNKVLVIDSTIIRKEQTGPSRLVELHEKEFRKLHSQLDQLNQEKSRHVIDWTRMQDKLQEYDRKYEAECRARRDAEDILTEFRKDVEEATMVRMNLEKTVESQQVEINFLKKEREEEVNELMVRIENIKVNFLTMGVSKLDLTSALKEIRAQYESIVSNNQQSAVDLYDNRIAELFEQVARSKEVITASREKMNESRRQLQSKIIEMESLRGTYKSLEMQFHEAEDRHNLEIGNYQDNMVKLENDLLTTRSQMARHVREYHDLLNVKLALDTEIVTYRKILDREENLIANRINNSGSHYRGSISYKVSTMEDEGQPQSMFSSNVFCEDMKSALNIEETEKQQSKSGGKVFQVYEEKEETVVIDAMEMVDTDAMWEQQDPSDIPTNQNN